MQKLNLTRRGEAWGVFYHFQLLGLKEKISPQLVSKLYIFSRGYTLRGTWRLGCLHSSRKWEEWVASGMTDGPPRLQLPLCCLPPSSELFGSPGEWPEGTCWPVLVALKSCWHGRKELGGMAQYETRGQFLRLAPFFFFSPREAWEQLLLRSSLPSCIPRLQPFEE